MEDEKQDRTRPELGETETVNVRLSDEAIEAARCSLAFERGYRAGMWDLLSFLLFMMVLSLIAMRYTE